MTIENGKVIIHAVHDRDVEGVWHKLGLKDEEKCAICEKVVTTKNVAAFAPFAGDVSVCCEKGSCFLEFNSRKRRAWENR